MPIAINPTGIDFGQTQLNAWALGHDFFDVSRYPKASCEGRFDAVSNKVPTQLLGELTLHGITRPMALNVNRLRCIAHPMLQREVRGADASGSLKREEFGLDAGKAYGFKMEMNLRLQVQAIAAPCATQLARNSMNRLPIGVIQQSETKTPQSAARESQGQETNEAQGGLRASEQENRL